jgi:hypothetical protein
VPICRSHQTHPHNPNICTTTEDPGVRVAKCLSGYTRVLPPYTRAIQVMEQYESTVTQAQQPDSDPTMEKYENSEMYMFKAMVFEEAGKRREALVGIGYHPGLFAQHSVPTRV